nr:zinc finger MYM-type protein 1-like [Parasteatoda tepidariorum]
MRAKSGDETLKKHINQCGGNAMYISPSIQNELIEICGSIIQETIVDRINKASSFAILADETMDITQTEQLTLCARQGYDGASAMRGNFNGAQAAIKELHPTAIYVHCSSHSLNLAISHSCSIQAFRNCVGIVKTITKFIKSSAKRTKILEDIMKTNLSNEKFKKIISFCETRWIENHDAIIRFKELYPEIIQLLEEVKASGNCDASSKADNLISTITKSEFYINLLACRDIFSVTLPLSKALQQIHLDLNGALIHVKSINNTVLNKRKNAEYEFQKLYLELLNTFTSLDLDVKLPRLASYQNHPGNIKNQNTDPEQYFRQSIYIPFLDCFAAQLIERFSKHEDTLASLNKVLPKYCVNVDINLCNFRIYADFIDIENLMGEMEVWASKWNLREPLSRPDTALSAMEECGNIFFPNIYCLLSILATLPITTATAERTFSTLERKS